MLKISSLGFLRLSLLCLAIFNTLIPISTWFLDIGGEAFTESSTWEVLTAIVAPVMAPILIVVVLLDYIMARVRAGDEDEEPNVRARFKAIARLELLVLLAMIIGWIPFFYSLGR